jgi:hypothetical protein
MAHLEKFKAPSVGHMLAHYTRSKEAVLERDNVDRTRSNQNYTLVFHKTEERTLLLKTRHRAQWDTVKERIEEVEESTGKKVRKDAVIMADMVITAPRNVPDTDLDTFFELCYEFMAYQVGMDNLLGGYVHMDETTPHMHVPFTPIKDGRFNFKQLCPRSFYQNFHKHLGGFLEDRMGYRPDIELPKERKEEKVLSQVSQANLDIARAAILDPLEQEREELERKRKELEVEIEEATARLESVRQRTAAIEEKNRYLGKILGMLRYSLKHILFRMRERGIPVPGRSIMEKGAEAKTSSSVSRSRQVEDRRSSIAPAIPVRPSRSPGRSR